MLASHLPMKPKRDISSFVLRFTQDIWQDDQGEPRVEWRGHVRHVQDGKELHFKDVAEAMHFFQAVLLSRTNECMKQADEGEREKVVAESKKLWERFAASYTDMFADAVQQTQRQVTDVVDSVMRPVHWVTGLVTGREEVVEPTESERLLAAIRSLEQQLQTLNTKLAAASNSPAEKAGKITRIPASDQPLKITPAGRRRLTNYVDRINPTD